MALGSKCGSCGHGQFEIKENSPRGSRYKLMLIQCASCGVPVAAQDYYNTGAQLTQQQQKIDQIAHQVNVLEGSLYRIEQLLQQIAQGR